MNPRYLAYCADTGGLSPEDTLARDREEWPGGVMCGFMLWIRARWNEWKAEVDYPASDPAVSTGDHCAFDAWLAKR